MPAQNRTCTWILLLPLFLLSEAGWAHEGPPNPMFVDRPLGPYNVSIWGDPDIGTGRFYIVINGETIPPDLRVRMRVRPVDNRVAETWYPAEQQKAREGARYVVNVPFEKQEKYTILFEVSSRLGTERLPTIVEATPDDVLGPFGIALYLAPFLALGGIWLKAFLKSKKKTGTRPD